MKTITDDIDMTHLCEGMLCSNIWQVSPKRSFTMTNHVNIYKKKKSLNALDNPDIHVIHKFDMLYT